MRQGTAHTPLLHSRPPLAAIAREDRPRYDTAVIAALTETDRDDVLRNLRDAEGLLREILPELVLRLDGPGDEFLTGAAAEATTKLTAALRSLEERVEAAAPRQGHD